jgi:hypothetical protein
MGFDVGGADIFDHQSNGDTFTVPRYGGTPRYPPAFSVDYNRDLTAGTTGVLGSTVEVGDWSSTSGLHSITSGVGVRTNTATFQSRFTVANTTIVPQLDSSKPWWLYAEGSWAGGDFITIMLLFGDNGAGANQRLWGFDTSSGAQRFTKIQGNGLNGTNFGAAAAAAVAPGSFTMELRKFATGSPGPAAPIGFWFNGSLIQSFTSDVFGGSPITCRWGFAIEENAAPLTNATLTRWRLRGNT